MNLGMQTMLAIDAALGPCSVAVSRNGEIAVFLREERPQMQARLLVPMIRQAMAEAGTDYSALGAVVATVGPGSFTGVRIGLSTARGIGFASGVPVKGATTLACAAFDALAHAENGAVPILAALGAGKGEVYCQHFSSRPFAAASPAFTATPEAALAGTDGHIVSGTPVDTGSRFHTCMPDARHAALLAHFHPALLVEPEPFYIRLPDAKPMRV